ncbi:cysteine hydrolase family protein [Tuberibacillus sp. Marseille-P3662]|uniref:cysteine hydrolase family protein n=1 Tax=Tuberibacillus sp. Marseille-P3662 TaxID=1965358 RepID=UPI000A1CA02A|nr:cysteine hydrolase family protein [Tuberibacillus sp. Marseille-P3662]
MSDHSALLIIDVQKAMFPVGDGVYKGETVIDNLQKLIRQARTEGVPVIYIQHDNGKGTPLERGTDGWHIHRDIKPLNEDLVVEKQTPDAFHQTHLESILTERSINHLCITGMQTELCVDTTTRRAFSLGFDVTLISDGHSTFDTDHLKAEQIIQHHNDLLVWFARTQEANEVDFCEIHI